MPGTTRGKQSESLGSLNVASEETRETGKRCSDLYGNIEEKKKIY
jgi:hypothetical protein